MYIEWSTAQWKAMTEQFAEAKSIKENSLFTADFIAAQYSAY